MDFVPSRREEPKTGQIVASPPLKSNYYLTAVEPGPDLTRDGALLPGVRSVSSRYVVSLPDRVPGSPREKLIPYPGGLKANHIFAGPGARPEPYASYVAPRVRPICADARR